MRPYQKEVEEKRELSSKEASKQELLDYYSQLNPYQQYLYVKEVIHQFMEYKEKADYLYLHHFNEN